jgi:hypothetical protein
MFGNPLFPLMNGVFRSPEFTTEPLRHFRFIPDSFAAALWRPFAMLDPVRMVHEELCAPDMRYALLTLLVGWLSLRWLRRRVAGSPTSAPAESDDTGRVLTALGFGLAADWVLWLHSSGNSRYFLPMACVAAVVIVGLLFRLTTAQPKVRNYILAAILGVQALQLWAGTEYRWNAVPWGGKWFDIAVPEELRTQPSLYLTIGMQTNSFVAPFLARASGLSNFSGGYALGPDGANGARMTALVRRYAPHLRVLFPGAKPYERGEAVSPQVDIALQRIGLRVDTHDCATITAHGLPPDLQTTFTGKDSEVVVPQAPNTTYLVSCHLFSGGTADSARYTMEQHAADLVLDRLEDACPELFQPRRPITDPGSAGWVRRYSNTDLMAWVSHGGVKFLQLVGDSRVVSVGRESDWARAPLRLVCGRRNDEYFAKVLPSEEGP